jgi:hypothetical protein
MPPSRVSRDAATSMTPPGNRSVTPPESRDPLQSPSSRRSWLARLERVCGNKGSAFSVNHMIDICVRVRRQLTTCQAALVTCQAIAQEKIVALVRATHEIGELSRDKAELTRRNGELTRQLAVLRAELDETIVSALIRCFATCFSVFLRVLTCL